MSKENHAKKSEKTLMRVLRDLFTIILKVPFNSPFVVQITLILANTVSPNGLQSNFKAS